MLLSTGYSVDLRGVDRNFNDLIGFTKINITTSQFGQVLPNIKNSVKNIKIKTFLWTVECQQMFYIPSTPQIFYVHIL